ncbi:MAG: ATP-binding cassette domain-containing protein [Clostridia bacterium]|jgi:ABC-2 type transport system ATP-binding protein|nr:ATP-binding cassette domain-containing protein [Clostridia bacterium]MBR5264055.1 ATP-binding cassette domain-containing protein [Clostridia bacterium]MBR6553452.1 ATP-binding cassette domain-containing protein [Clostridia bacterium]
MIEINGLSKVFGTQRAVDDVSFRVEEGEIMGFLGPNGAGKSTTMNILTGYLSATSGTCRVNGIDILENPLEAKRNIGFLPEMPPLYTDMTVKEYLSFIYDLKGCTFPRNQHLREICDVVKIGDVYDRLIGNLSKGYRQRVGIAQALIGNPRVLIFDEPTVGLDPKQIIDIRNLIRMLGKEHTIILSTHILPEVQAVCDRIVVINKGKVVANEKTEDLVTAVDGSRKMVAKVVGPQDEVLKTLKGVAGIRSVDVLGKRDTDSISYLIESEDRVDARKPLFYTLASKGWPLVGLEGMELSLEDIFIRLVGEQRKGRNAKGGKN